MLFDIYSVGTWVRYNYASNEPVDFTLGIIEEIVSPTWVKVKWVDGISYWCNPIVGLIKI